MDYICAVFPAHRNLVVMDGAAAPQVPLERPKRQDYDVTYLEDTPETEEWRRNAHRVLNEADAAVQLTQENERLREQVETAKNQTRDVVRRLREQEILVQTQTKKIAELGNIIRGFNQQEGRVLVLLKEAIEEIADKPDGEADKTEEMMVALRMYAREPTGRWLRNLLLRFALGTTKLEFLEKEIENHDPFDDDNNFFTWVFTEVQENIAEEAPLLSQRVLTLLKL